VVETAKDFTVGAAIRMEDCLIVPKSQPVSYIFTILTLGTSPDMHGQNYGRTGFSLDDAHLHDCFDIPV
jgi:hypothetical protein